MRFFASQSKMFTETKISLFFFFGINKCLAKEGWRGLLKWKWTFQWLIWSSPGKALVCFTRQLLLFCFLLPPTPHPASSFRGFWIISVKLLRWCYLEPGMRFGRGLFLSLINQYMHSIFSSLYNRHLQICVHCQQPSKKNYLLICIFKRRKRETMKCL